MKQNKSNMYIKAVLLGVFGAIVFAAIVLGVILMVKNRSEGSKETKAQTEITAESETAGQTETSGIVIEPDTEETEAIQTESAEPGTDAALGEGETDLASGETQASADGTLPETEQSQTEMQAALPAADAPLVVIDAGHQGPGQDMSGYEPMAPGSSETKPRIVTGTQGSTTGLAEYDLNLSVSLLLQQELQNRGYQVLMTRTTNDINISNIERADVANQAGADIMVRIHANGSEDSSVSGALTMAPSASNPYVGYMYNECNALASCIINAYCAATGLANDGIMETDTMTGINWCQVPVAIVEMGFMTNPGDDTYMADPGNQAVMASGIADGIDQYFGR